MEIVDYELFEVPPRWLFLKIETSEGIVGWGEPVVEGRAKTVRIAVEELMDNYMVGEDPRRIEDHWHKMYRGGFYRGGPVLMSAIAGVDQALWDIKGKYYDAPVHELLGGRVRDRMRIYQWIGGDRPSDVRKEAREKIVDKGLTALKMNATGEFRRIESPAKIDQAVKRVEAVRDEVGKDVDIGLDFHGRVSKSMAVKLADRFEEYDPMFIEEPVLSGNNEALKDISSHTTIPIATGERMYSRWDFKPVLKQGSVDIIQADPSHAGGITELNKIASMAEAHDVSIAPHCPLGPISFASALQVDACSHNAIIQEQSLGIHYNKDTELHDYLANPEVFDYEDGYIDVPEASGLGVEIDEEAVRKHSGDVDWHNPVWRHKDGSVAEW